MTPVHKEETMHQYADLRAVPLLSASQPLGIDVSVFKERMGSENCPEACR
jgi:hypothetical protein